MSVEILTYMAGIGIGGLDIPSLLMAFFAFVAFLITWALNRISVLRTRKRVGASKEISAVMQHTLELNNNQVLRLDLRLRHATNLYGSLLPPEGLSYEEGYEYIHPDDRPVFQKFIGELYYGRSSTGECVFRWDVSGKAHREEWRYMRNVAVAEYAEGENKGMPIHIFCTMIDCTEQVLHEREEQEMVDKYQQTFEQSIVGIAFYDKDGKMLAANKKLREILRFQSDDDPYYFGNTLFDMPTFRDVLNHRRVEELYFCTKSVVIERGVSCYTELRLHPIADENGDLLFITLSVRDVTQERDLYLQNKRNNQEIRFANEAIQEYENEIQYLMDSCDLRFWRASFADRTITFYRGLRDAETQVTFEQQQAIFVKSAFKEALDRPEELLSKPMSDLALCRPYFQGHEAGKLVWNMIDSVPYHDEQGRQLGTYGIIRNVTPLIEKQEQLKRETERANDSGRLKSMFMANMTHEIRTPLNSIVGFSDVLPMMSTPEEKKEIIRVILNNCDMLLRLINDILAISSLDTGGISVEPRKVDFAKSFNDICESLKERVQEPGVAFIKENPYESLKLVIDNGRIQQVITNFVTNAVKYTRQGHIKVGYRLETGLVDDKPSDGLYFYCEDTGTGIPKESQERIFERFVKLNDYVQGTGLGLSICKAIADASKGRIGVISEGEDKGSVFWMWVPVEVDGATLVKNE